MSWVSCEGPNSICPTRDLEVAGPQIGIDRAFLFGNARNPVRLPTDGIGARHPGIAALAGPCAEPQRVGNLVSPTRLSVLAAKLMVDQVCRAERYLSVGFLLSGFTGSRVMRLPDYSCGTGLQSQSPGPIKDASGRRIGRTYDWCPST